MKAPALLVAVLSVLTPCLAVAQTEENPPALKPLPPDGFVTLETVRKDFTENEPAAMKKYNGARITVYGRVGEVAPASDMEGDPMAVFLQNPNNITPDVKAVFNQPNLPQGNLVVQNNDSEADIYKHRNTGIGGDWRQDLPSQKPLVIKGQMVGITGTFDNFVAGDVVIKECQLMKEKELIKKLKEHGIATE